ncbi:hypothetical protein AVEN_91009-1 [Araneus ventricosus]|uniref:Uncharacterized protein n=1 Tax=Araneus ventricosus TaxID=182803 RepID=A0A4Y2TZD6_ARAVE|nr:hypothetical protein AVEN_91009-1 [Araneus ventricosus]
MHPFATTIDRFSEPGSERVSLTSVLSESPETSKGQAWRKEEIGALGSEPSVFQQTDTAFSYLSVFYLARFREGKRSVARGILESTREEMERVRKINSGGGKKGFDGRDG